MYSGKTKWLIEAIQSSNVTTRLYVHEASAHHVKERGVLRSRSGVEHPVIAVKDHEQLFDDVKAHRNAGSEYFSVAIDELQFFDYDIFYKIEEIVSLGNAVLVAGLDTDFRGLPYGMYVRPSALPALMAVADQVVKLQARCAVCGDTATRTQRLIDGEPAPFDSPLMIPEVLDGGRVTYQARCRRCHKIF